MKHIPMGRNNSTGRRGPPRPPGGGGGKPPRTPAIDLFIDRGLHELFDSIVKEPIPEDWRRMIEDSRSLSDDPMAPGGNLPPEQAPPSTPDPPTPKPRGKRKRGS